MKLSRYRIKSDGAYEFHTFEVGHKFNQSIWLENKGSFQLKEDDSYYTYYNEDGTVNLIKEQEVEDKVFNDDIYKQIETLETSLIRPMRELLSTSTSEEDKTFAQSKVDSIEADIQALRLTLR